MLLKKYDQSKFLANFLVKQKNSQLITNFSALDITLKLDPSFFTKATIFFPSIIFTHIKSIKLQAKACLIVSKASNNLTMTRFSCQSFPKKIKN